MIVSLCLMTIGSRFSPLPCWELVWPRCTPTTWGGKKDNMSHLAWLMSLVLLGEKKNEILDVFFFLNSSLRPSRASLDQSMHDDVRSKFLRNLIVGVKTIQNISRSLPRDVAVQYLCIYFCCYLMTIIYCVRTRFALCEDEFQLRQEPEHSDRQNPPLPQVQILPISSAFSSQYS